jgi:hypothetical protein
MIGFINHYKTWVANLPHTAEETTERLGHPDTFCVSHSGFGRRRASAESQATRSGNWLHDLMNDCFLPFSGLGCLGRFFHEVLNKLGERDPGNFVSISFYSKENVLYMGRYSISVHPG